MQQEAPVNGAQSVHSNNSISPSHSRSVSDPADFDGDSYSDPIDLIAHRDNGQHRHSSYRPGEHVHSKQSSGASRDSMIYSDENYSNPVDMLRNGPNAGPARSESYSELALPPPCRQTKLAGKATTSKNLAPNGHDNIAAAIDPTYPIVGVAAVPLATILPSHLDYTADTTKAPVPPYMPIQGTRRTNGVAQSDKKKRAKDKCTHQ